MLGDSRAHQRKGVRGNFPLSQEGCEQYPLLLRPQLRNLVENLLNLTHILVTWLIVLLRQAIVKPRWLVRSKIPY